MDVTSNGGLLYVTRGKFCNDVLVINTTRFEIIKRIPVGKYPDHIIINLMKLRPTFLGVTIRISVSI